ncbi:long-chain fatty-acid--CoA ligase [Gordonia hirsuta DSM 44140 = NBRC 16056]|uniref:Long-chain fatty-acid--CoA ligase n=1 Tax=Gordonia hirsuta DSM 44140 = NBRC 16056 TaxID=1121927 RepID=L7L7V1_9ACTN|nr:AMP-binding protein [Gordonia hirsuta]GAC56974.1 long-chain fatty-acid--CoA ligase [Gordonia hirsuta DSM 44140 = NBRC 16056]
MTGYDERPWLAAYPPGRRPHLRREFATALDLFESAAATAPDGPALHYFDQTLTWSQVDAAAAALAALLVARGFAPGDRLALCLQNDPAFVIGLVAAWKAGGTAAPLSPMSTTGELARSFGNVEPSALLVLEDLYLDRIRPVLATGTTSVRVVVTVSPLDGQHTADPRIFAGSTRLRPADTVDLTELIAAYTSAPPLPDSPERRVGPSDVAVLAATSGTSGPSKDAQITHANLAFSAQVYRDWTGLSAGEPILALAPVFHVTGLVGGVVLAMLTASPLVLTHRFHAGVIAEATRRHRPVFCAAVITAYIALAEDPDVRAADLESLRLRYSGGAPIDPEIADRLEEQLGGYIHNIYGQTETSSPSHAVPPGTRSPVDPESGVMSVGVPVFDTDVRVVDDDGNDLPVGEIGELVTMGPQVIPGYWRDPIATAETFSGGALHTGDVGFMDADGWFYVVDRKKDQINAAGYKVWPSEVERVLATHPDIEEAAVIGIPDEYRGETVKAFVVPAAGVDLAPAEVIAYCRDRLAAYKYPREVEVLTALPRTATGKILRRKLR